MDLYLAASAGPKCHLPDHLFNDTVILESFIKIRPWQVDFLKKGIFKKFMLDSGAFTFMRNKKIFHNWDDYAEKYAYFIKENKIDLFFELDIDSVVGIDRVEELRKKIEKITNKKSIPVWHISRGWEYFIRMVQEYDYIGFGVFLTDNLDKNKYKYIPKFINKARQNNCKIHGLGFISPTGMKKYKFDSVDSAAWIYSNVTGQFIWVFDGQNIKKKGIRKNDKYKNLKINSKHLWQHNFKEWVKYQKYAEENL
jgi:hypothetical protein